MIRAGLHATTADVTELRLKDLLPKMAQQHVGAGYQLGAQPGLARGLGSSPTGPLHGAAEASSQHGSPVSRTSALRERK